NGSGREVVQRGAESVAALADALSQSGSPRPTPVWVLTRSVYEVTGEESLDPLRAAAVGVCQSVPLRYPGVVCRCLDLSLPGSGSSPEGLVDRILREIGQPRPEQSAALRGAHRWTPTLETLDARRDAGAPGEPGAEFRPGGGYLLVGTLQGASFRFARQLAEWGASRLVLVEPAAPSNSEAQRVQELEELNAEVRLVRTLLSDRDGLQHALVQARQAEGGLRGVVCSAEAAFAGGDSRQVGSALLGLEKGLGTLDEALIEDRPEVQLLVSLSASAGGMGLEAGFASNLFLESYAQASRRRGKGWTSLHWDVWDKEGGDAGNRADEAFRAVLSLCRSNTAARLLVSSRPLDAQWNRLVGLEDESGQGTSGEDSAPLHPRPELRVEYTAPETETQKAIAAVWERLLGIDRVGLDDGFLELGGDSLLASRLVARLQDVLQLDLPVRLFFEASTVRELTQAVEEIRSRQEDQELKELFEQLEGLSEAEVRRELAKRGH
ncbi:MAG: KR domain-containing protein, partial [Acidobacteriota bacterium]